MSCMAGKRGADADRTYEWEIRNFVSMDGSQVSDPFTADAYFWRLQCYPKPNTHSQSHVSLFLEYPAASVTPTDRLPTATYTLTIVNHKQPALSLSKSCTSTYTREANGWGFREMLPLTDATVAKGFLRADGALVVRVEIKVKDKKRLSDSEVASLAKKCKAASSVTTDLLTLLQDPGPASDLTLTAGGRSIPVHRAILAARCDFFKTMFASGFDDSTSKQVAMPDTDPDALQLLLRFIYGGVLDSCPQALLKPAAELADRLRLTDALVELEDCILNGTGPESIVDDMLWAERRGSSKLSKSLQEAYLKTHVKKVSESALATLAEQNPKLMARLCIISLGRSKP
ncbi:ubiquitin-specific protease ubp15 [Pleodorina starrii]|uniref:Ubiquitin-specific protease ubp15 n=1 Tax=Pleodorina starrii TaxID=330485 RepID=A0A9W6BJP7_9CHLO|nr:ubiquitin-specific protease ubp15 [Pleodorina starrii]